VAPAFPSRFCRSVEVGLPIRPRPARRLRSPDGSPSIGLAEVGVPVGPGPAPRRRPPDGAARPSAWRRGRGSRSDGTQRLRCGRLTGLPRPSAWARPGSRSDGTLRLRCGRLMALPGCRPARGRAAGRTASSTSAEAAGDDRAGRRPGVLGRVWDRAQRGAVAARAWDRAQRSAVAARAWRSPARRDQVEAKPNQIAPRLSFIFTKLVRISDRLRWAFHNVQLCDTDEKLGRVHRNLRQCLRRVESQPSASAIGATF
jgi:hypothetical protein